MEMVSFRDSSTMIEPKVFDGGTEGARRATGVTPSAGRTEEPAMMSPQEPEVPEKKPRRKFTAQYKLHILEEADACDGTGQIGALLRREGLYYSNLTIWKRQKEEGLLEALSPKKRGHKVKQKDRLSQRVPQLERENERLRKKLKQAETIIDVQKKFQRFWGSRKTSPSRKGKTHERSLYLEP